MPYIDWGFYNSLFDKITDEDSFNRIYKKAELYFDTHTHFRAKTFMKEFDETIASDFEIMKANAIKMTICELINNMFVQEMSEMGIGISSVSNDGYSESYKITTAAEKEIQLMMVIRSGLSGTGLAGAL